MNDPSSFRVFPAHRGDVPFPPSINERFGPAHILPAMPLLRDSVQTGAGGANMTAHLPQSAVAPQDFGMMGGVEQGMLALSGTVVSGLVMDTGVLPAPVLSDITTPAIPAVPMGESPMTGVQTAAETPVQPCIYDLLSSPHVLPRESTFQYLLELIN